MDSVKFEIGFVLFDIERDLSVDIIGYAWYQTEGYLEDVYEPIKEGYGED